MLFIQSTPVYADSTGTEAYRILKSGDYTAARAAYGNIAGYAGRYGEGAACFYLQAWDCAAKAFATAAWLAQDDGQRARAAYNLATVLYRQGDYEQAAVLYHDARKHGLQHPQLDAYIDYAEVIDAQVKQRLRQAGIRRGRGLRSAPVQTNDGPAIPRSLEESKKREIPLPKGMDKKAFEQLVMRGLDRARIATEGKSDGQSRAWFGGEDVAAERAGSALWKRLFEIEEGFPAVLEKPRQRPQERAW